MNVVMEKTINPLVSIVIPLYNQEKYFRACKRSVCKQTYKNLEIVIVNDGSTDRSPLMAHEWAAQDDRVKVIDKQNEGLAFARRDGLLASSGEYVMFLDSDDTLTHNAVELLITCAINKSADLVMGSWDKMIGFIKRRHADAYCSFPLNQLITQPELFEKYFLGFFRNSIFPVSACAKLYRKSVIDNALKEAELYSADVPFTAEDHLFSVNLFPYLGSMYRIGETVYNYRYGGGTFGYNKNFPQWFVVSDKRLKLLDKYNYTEGYKPLFDEYVASLYGYAAMMIHYKAKDKEGVKAFFVDEIEHREVMHRMLEYYEQNGMKRDDVQLLREKDIEGIYSKACLVEKQSYGSMKYRISEMLVKFLSKIDSFIG